MPDEKARAAVKAQLTDYLQSQQMRKTPERFAILDRIFLLPDLFSSTDLHQAMEQDGYRVSLASVYNTLKLFVEAGLVEQRLFQGHPTRFTLRGQSVPAPLRHQMVCSRCGKIRQFADPEIDQLLVRRSYGSFTPTNPQVIVYGLCRSCKKKTRNSAPRSPGGLKPRK